MPWMARKGGTGTVLLIFKVGTRWSE